MDIDSQKIGVDVNISGGNSYNISNKPGVTNPPNNVGNSVTTGTVVPTSTPKKIGDIYIKTDTKKVYMATGISSSSDWTLLN